MNEKIEKQQELRDTFDLFDADRRGRIDARELKASPPLFFCRANQLL